MQEHYEVEFRICILDMSLLSFKKFTSLITAYKVSQMGNPASNEGLAYLKHNHFSYRGMILYKLKVNSEKHYGNFLLVTDFN